MIPRAQPEGSCSRCGRFCEAIAFTDQFLVCDVCGSHVADVTKMLGSYQFNERLFEWFPSVIRHECAVLPVMDTVLLIDFRAPDTEGTIEKLSFILNREINWLHADRSKILAVTASVARRG